MSHIEALNKEIVKEKITSHTKLKVNMKQVNKRQIDKVIWQEYLPHVKIQLNAHLFQLIISIGLFVL